MVKISNLEQAKKEWKEISIGRAQNLIGKKFNRLTILYRTENSKSNATMWVCKCKCGNYIKASGGGIVSGNTKSCGCFRRKDLIGKKFGKLTVIDYTDKNRNNSALWKCKCDCGNITYATTAGLMNSDNVSCGCRNLGCEKFKQRYMVNLIGKQFGQLTVLDSTDMRSNKGNQIWKCKCNCGNICYVSTNHLQTGNTKSCGCLLGRSSGEQIIKQLLEKHNIKYKKEFCFPNNTRRFDFAIFDNNNNLIQLIEFDGEQHYQEVPYFNTTLKEQQQIDLEKNQIAEQNNVKLIRIPYWKRNTLTFEDLQING